MYAIRSYYGPFGINLLMYIGSQVVFDEFNLKIVDLDMLKKKVKVEFLPDKKIIELEAGQTRFIFSGAYNPSSPVAAHHMVHGDGVKVIAMEVNDVEQAWKATTERGAKSAWAPREERDDHGIFRTSAIYTYGETLHTFVDRGA